MTEIWEQNFWQNTDYCRCIMIYLNSSAVSKRILIASSLGTPSCVPTGWTFSSPGISTSSLSPSCFGAPLVAVHPECGPTIDSWSCRAAASSRSMVCPKATSVPAWATVWTSDFDFHRRSLLCVAPKSWRAWFLLWLVVDVRWWHCWLDARPPRD